MNNSITDMYPDLSRIPEAVDREILGLACGLGDGYSYDRWQIGRIFDIDPLEVDQHVRTCISLLQSSGAEDFALALSKRCDWFED